MPRPVIPLREYQRKFIEDPARFRVWMASRRVGKSWAVSLDAVLEIYRGLATGVASDCILISASQKQTNKLMETVRKHVDMMTAAGAPRPVSVKAEEIAWGSNHHIYALSSNISSIRGYGGSVVIDEFTLHADQDELIAAALPVIGVGGRISVVSTPFGPGDYFHALMTNASNGWSKHSTDIHQAVEQGLTNQDGTPFNIPELRAAISNDDLWAREFEIKWTSAGSSAFLLPALHRCQVETLPTPCGPTFIGVDIGLTRDFTAYVVIDSEGVVRAVERLRGARFEDQITLLSQLVKTWASRSVLIDQTTFGTEWLTQAQERLGSMVDGLRFTLDSKLDLVTCLRNRVEAGTVSWTRESELTSELASIKQVALPSGRYRIEAPRNSAGHADAAFAFMLAAYALEKATTDLSVTITPGLEAYRPAQMKGLNHASLSH